MVSHCILFRIQTHFYGLHSITWSNLGLPLQPHTLYLATLTSPHLLDQAVPQPYMHVVSFSWNTLLHSTFSPFLSYPTNTFLILSLNTLSESILLSCYPSGILFVSFRAITYLFGYLIIFIAEQHSFKLCDSTYIQVFFQSILQMCFLFLVTFPIMFSFSLAYFTVRI